MRSIFVSNLSALPDCRRLNSVSANACGSLTSCIAANRASPFLPPSSFFVRPSYGRHLALQLGLFLLFRPRHALVVRLVHVLFADAAARPRGGPHPRLRLLTHRVLVLVVLVLVPRLGRCLRGFVLPEKKFQRAHHHPRRRVLTRVRDQVHRPRVAPHVPSIQLRDDRERLLRRRLVLVLERGGEKVLHRTVQPLVAFVFIRALDVRDDVPEDEHAELLVLAPEQAEEQR
mmetsp:Transcript_3941/g.13675  ORF Transcript_3941/g.13675 Transcript_3941/m.13675 type:complete len:230 (-) Transcript_3941:484-1173(-)